jgi:hypothetical protein
VSGKGAAAPPPLTRHTIVLALNAPYGEFQRLQDVSASYPLLTALVLPSVTYLILSATAALAAAVALKRGRAAIAGHAPPVGGWSHTGAR